MDTSIVDSSNKSNKLKEFIKEIQRNNRNPKDNSVLSLLDIKETNPSIVLGKGYLMYRCRIISDSKKISKDKGFYGYNSEESFVTPWKKSTDMRANYRYIPYLYCASARYTSVIESRPRLSAEVSVATIQVLEDLTLLDLTNQHKPKGIDSVKTNLFAALSELFSKPISSSDDVLDYIPTQYIAEYVKNLGYDGISYKSSLHINALRNSDKYNPETDNKKAGVNYVIFNYGKCKAIASNVYRIIETNLSCEQIDKDAKREEITY